MRLLLYLPRLTILFSGGVQLIFLSSYFLGKCTPYFLRSPYYPEALGSLDPEGTYQSNYVVFVVVIAIACFAATMAIANRIYDFHRGSRDILKAYMRSLPMESEPRQ